jgi:hypothetical protein
MEKNSVPDQALSDERRCSVVGKIVYGGKKNKIFYFF